MSRVVILSPHADDAVWSLGGVLAGWASRTGVTVITVFNAEPDARALDALRSDKGNAWRYLPRAEVRHREDARAIAALGARVQVLPFVDAAMRYDTVGFDYPSMGSLFGPIRSADGPLRRRVSDALAASLEPGDWVVAPLGLGRHVDHRIVRDVAVDLSRDVIFYQDVPYSADLSDHDIQTHVRTVAPDLRPSDIGCDPAGWQAAALMYRSQVKRLFGRADKFRDLLHRQALRYGDPPVCRIWSRAATNLATVPFAASK